MSENKEHIDDDSQWIHLGTNQLYHFVGGSHTGNLIFENNSTGIRKSIPPRFLYDIFKEHVS